SCTITIDYEYYKWTGSEYLLMKYLSRNISKLPISYNYLCKKYVKLCILHRFSWELKHRSHHLLLVLERQYHIESGEGLLHRQGRRKLANERQQRKSRKKLDDIEKGQSYWE